MKPVMPGDKETIGNERVDRWVDQPPGDGEDAEFGALLRSAMRPEPLGPGQLAAVAARLTSPPARGWVPRLAWQMAIVLVVLIGGGAFVAARMDLLHRLPGFAPHKGSVPPDPPTTVRAGLRYLDAPTLSAMFVLGPDMAPVETEVNRLDNQALVRYYEAEWRRWN